MAFEIPEGVHEELMPLAWMLGTWGGRGHGEYPGTEKFEYQQEVVFGHDGRPFMTYFSRTWIITPDGEIVKPAAQETGFWRVKPGNILEVEIAHSIGIVEGWVGRFDGPKIQLVRDGAVSSPSAKVIDDGARLYGLVEGHLFTSYDMAYGGHKLQAHTWSSLERQNI